MKKYFLGLALIGCIPSLFSAPVGNTAFPKIIQEGLFIPSECWANIRAGYEGDFVFDARLKQYMEGSGRVDNYDMTTNSGTVTLNLLDRLDIYGIFGASYSNSDWRFWENKEIVHHAEMETHHNFLWGVGTRAILYAWGNGSLGLGARYSSVDNDPAWLTIDGAGASVAGAHAHWKEWQVNLDISYKIDLLIPYIGAKYGKARVELEHFATPIATNGSGTNHFESKIPVGLYLGCTFSTGKYFMLNVEGRLIDEEAITVSGDLRF